MYSRRFARGKTISDNLDRFPKNGSALDPVDPRS